MKSRHEPGGNQTHNEETSEVYMIKVFRVEEQVWDSKVFSETSGNHGKQDYPTENQDNIPFKVIEEQLDRKRIREPRSKIVKPSKHSH